jgi:hypothetical protein
VVPVTYAPPREGGTPVLQDAGEFATGIIVGDSAFYEIEGDDDGGVQYTYLYYYIPLPLPDGGPPSWLDAGDSDQQVIFTPQYSGSYQVCAILLEVDAGFGNCGLDAGVPGKFNPLCSSPIVAAF